MDARKRKQIEDRLRQLMQAANLDAKDETVMNVREKRPVQVIRRRKGRPDWHISTELASKPS
ncbi:MAG: hypothetical protein ACOWWM_13600 [Desulfobacterales bacterium]|jgi:hypothetical protein